MLEERGERVEGVNGCAAAEWQETRMHTERGSSKNVREVLTCVLL